MLKHLEWLWRTRHHRRALRVIDKRIIELIKAGTPLPLVPIRKKAN